MILSDKYLWTSDSLVVDNPKKLQKHGTHDQSKHGNWARGRISQTQARDIASQAIAGGFSFNPASKSSPKSGYMIARTGATTMVGDANNLEEAARALKTHLDQNVDKYLREPNLYIGGWVKDGKLWIEPSDNWSNKAQAVRLGKMRDQIAIWDVVNFQEIQTGGTGGERAESGSNRAPSEIFKSVSNAEGMEFDDRGTEDGLVKRSDSVHHKESVVKHLPGQHDQSEHAGARAKTPEQIQSEQNKPQSKDEQKRQEEYDKPRTSAGSVKDRVKALAEKGRRIIIKPSEITEAMDEFADMKGDPDLTSMHIDGTNLYDEDNLGIPRNKMPQIPSDTKGTFISVMEKRGARVTRTEIDPTQLHPIQKEISASKVGLIMRKLRKDGTATDDGGRIVVSKDNYVIDGHHRWAAVAMLNFEDKSIKLPVIKVDINHQDLIDATLAWNQATGIQPIGLGESNRKGQIKKWAEFDAIVAKAVRNRTVIRFQPGLKPTLKHLSGQHDQKTHGSWAGYKSGDEESWGKERASALKAMENVGPTKQEILDAMTGAGNRVIPEDILDDDSYRLWVENNSRYYAEIVGQTVTSAQYESWRDANNIDDSNWAESTKYSQWQESEGIAAVEEVYEQTLNDFIERGKEDGWLTDRVMESNGYIQNDELEWFSEDNFGEGLQDLSNKFSEVYDFTKSITLNGSNTKDTISSAVTNVERAGNRLRVNGEVYNSKGENLGSFEREFYQDDDGSLVVDHDLLSIEDPAYTGNGFGTDFHMRQENYYITHGVDKVYVHAALDVGGYMWAKMGFQWDENKSESSKARIGDRIANFVDDTEYTDSQTSAILSNYRDRLYDTDTTNDPEPWEIHALRDNRPDKTSTVGKDILLGSNWFGVKYMTPTGRENNTGQSDLARDESFSTWRVDDKVVYNQITGEVTGQLELGLGA
jgi:hypothetical protein